MTFKNILDYERKCTGFGYSTRRENFHKNGKAYIVSISRHQSGVETWQLFTADGTPAGLEGFVGENYLSNLAALGYLQDGKTAADYPKKFLKGEYRKGTGTPRIKQAVRAQAERRGKGRAAVILRVVYHQQPNMERGLIPCRH